MTMQVSNLFSSTLDTVPMSGESEQTTVYDPGPVGWEPSAY
jgi:hypothetical protein